VIINERIREEIAKGKSLRSAVADGYKHSYSAIFDGNITTLIVGVVLTFFGYGPVKGFAITLVIGILTSLFTAVGFTQVLFDFVFKRDWNIHFGNRVTMNLLKGINFQFMSKRKVAYTISTILFVASFASMIFVGFDLGVAFQGGRSYVVKFDKDVKTAAIADKLEKPLGSKPLVKTYGSNSQIQITTAYMINSTAANVDSIIEGKLYEGIGNEYAQKPAFSKFRSASIKSITKIDPTIADDIKRSALYSGFLGCLLIFIYIYIRFRKWEYAVGAVAATIHDPVIVLGLFSMLRYVMPFSLEVDENVVAAILTLIGYSVNDTVIVFDRIREFIKLYPTKPLIQNVDDSINTTLSRTIMTSVATELVCVVLFVFGGDSIRQFSFALMMGILVGTYSSIFIASPIMVDLLLRRKDTVKA
jgi:SecD/SecF fusion protein